MSITDELREWAGDNTLQDMVLTTYPPQHGVHGVLETLLRIADRIDAEHEKACDDAWNNGYEADYLGIEKWLTEHPQAMEHHGWVRLPVDADGEYIRIDDVMEWSDGSDKPFEVVGIGSGMLYYIDDDGIQWTRAENKRHYQPDTWERIIEDAIGDRIKDDGEFNATIDTLVARCEALAGDGE